MANHDDPERDRSGMLELYDANADGRKSNISADSDDEDLLSLLDPKKPKKKKEMNLQEFLLSDQPRTPAKPSNLDADHKGAQQFKSAQSGAANELVGSSPGRLQTSTSSLQAVISPDSFQCNTTPPLSFDASMRDVSPVSPSTPRSPSFSKLRGRLSAETPPKFSLKSPTKRKEVIHLTHELSKLDDETYQAATAHRDGDPEVELEGLGINIGEARAIYRSTALASSERRASTVRSSPSMSSLGSPSHTVAMRPGYSYPGKTRPFQPMPTRPPPPPPPPQSPPVPSTRENPPTREDFWSSPSVKEIEQRSSTTELKSKPSSSTLKSKKSLATLKSVASILTLKPPRTPNQDHDPAIPITEPEPPTVALNLPCRVSQDVQDQRGKAKERSSDVQRSDVLADPGSLVSDLPMSLETEEAQIGVITPLKTPVSPSARRYFGFKGALESADRTETRSTFPARVQRWRASAAQLMLMQKHPGLPQDNPSDGYPNNRTESLQLEEANVAQLRIRLGLGALSYADANDPIHPNHNFKWNTKNTWCKQCIFGPEAAEQTSALDAQAAKHLNKTKTNVPPTELQRARPVQCHRCKVACCMWATAKIFLDETKRFLSNAQDSAQAYDGMAKDTKLRGEIARSRLNAYSRIDEIVQIVRSGKEEDTFVRCNECNEVVCPRCAGQCPMKQCHLIVCKDCVEDPWQECYLHAENDDEMAEKASKIRRYSRILPKEV